MSEYTTSNKSFINIAIDANNILKLESNLNAINVNFKI